jgi:MazG family protein
VEAFDRLVEIMARLRAPGGCPWDREQDHQSIRKYVIEEAYEVAEAIDGGDPRELCTELGDLLLQVVFHAQMACEERRFDISDVCRAIAEKLLRRHPHVFGDVQVGGASEVVRNWEQIKAAERGPSASAIDGVPRALPALQRAERLGEKASRVGFDWASAAEVLAKIDEERRELDAALDGGERARIEDEIGDLLLAVANLARKLEIEPERALSRAVDRFAERFRHAERSARSSGTDLAELDPDALDALWTAAKRALDERR